MTPLPDSSEVLDALIGRLTPPDDALLRLIPIDTLPLLSDSVVFVPAAGNRVLMRCVVTSIKDRPFELL